MSQGLPDALFEHILIPVASEEDATVARETILPYLEDVGGVATVVHVVKQPEAGVAPSPPSVQEEDAQKLFGLVGRDRDDIVVGTRTVRGSDIAGAIFDVAREIDATAVVFSPPERSLLVRLLTGDVARALVSDPDVPVLSLPRRIE